MRCAAAPRLQFTHPSEGPGVPVLAVDIELAAAGPRTTWLTARELEAGEPLAERMPASDGGTTEARGGGPAGQFQVGAWSSSSSALLGDTGASSVLACPMLGAKPAASQPACKLWLRIKSPVPPRRSWSSSALFGRPRSSERGGDHAIVGGAEPGSKVKLRTPCGRPALWLESGLE